VAGGAQGGAAAAAAAVEDNGLGEHHTKEECPQYEECEGSSHLEPGAPGHQPRVPSEGCLKEADSGKDEYEDCCKASQHVDYLADVRNLDGEDEGEEEPGGGDHDPPHPLLPHAVLLHHQVPQQGVQALPATEEQDGVGGVGLGCHGDQRHHHHGLAGRVVGYDVLRHVTPEGIRRWQHLCRQ